MRRVGKTLKKNQKYREVI